MFVLLSYPLGEDTPVFDGNPGVKVWPYLLVREGERANNYHIQTINHNGTHIDLPKHVDDSSSDPITYGIERFVFERPVTIDIPKGDSELIDPEDLKEFKSRIEKADLLLIRTGFWKIRKTDPVRYGSLNPGFTVNGARYLMDNLPELRCIGLDFISASACQYVDEGMEAHRVLMGHRVSKREIFVIEDMNLSHDLSDIKRVWAVPLYISGIDSFPCTVIGEV